MCFRPFATLLLAALALPAAAHTPYLAPASFEVRADSVVTLDASFAETFFVPEVVFDNSTFAVTRPDGSTTAPDTVQLLKTRAVVEHTHRALGDGHAQPAPVVVTTDAAGKARFALTDAGSYLALIRYRRPAPAGAAAPMYGNNYTLSFRVLEP